jgi:hypothetical protein
VGQEIAIISPEGLEIANCYLVEGSIEAVCRVMNVAQDKVADWLQTREVKKYIDTVYMDTGYRNRNKLASVLDDILDSKLEEAMESEMFTKKDLMDVIAFAHKVRMDEAKLMQDAERGPTKSQTNVAILGGGGGFGDGNYGQLIKDIIDGESKRLS